MFAVKKARISTFSGGMKRRVSLAISAIGKIIRRQMVLCESTSFLFAIGNPSIIFLDEPTSGMDPKTRREIWEMIKRLK